MKAIFLLFISVLNASISIAQKEACDLKGTKWQIKNIEIKGTEDIAVESSLDKRLLEKYKSAQFYFYGKKQLAALWGEYKIHGKYKIKKGSQALDVSFRGLEFFEKGPVDKALFASFLYKFINFPKHFINDCSFVWLIERKGLEYIVFFEKVE